MPLILHLSDLHLGNRIHDDYKNECVPLEERISRAGLLRTTLRELGNEFRRNDDRLDAVIVSGDITVANNEDGFQMLPELLNELGDNYPGNERTIITPGNHDVTWFTNPSTPDHYANFLRYIRDNRYITPLLDGIDVDARGIINNHDNHFLLSPNHDWMIIPINSSNYSGSLEPIGDIPDDIWNEIPRLLGELGLDQDMVRGELTHLRLHDVARVSNAQLDGLRHLILNLENQIREAGNDPADTIRIAVLHHHLLPVSAAEEFKSFESITNLGLLHQFLRSHKFKIVLHGHKHTGRLYWNHIYDFANPRLGDPYRVLVISGSTLGGNDYHEDEVARLIDLKTAKYTPSVSIRRLPAVRPGMHLPQTGSTTIDIWPDEEDPLSRSARMRLIQGKNCSEVYARALTLFKDLPPNKELHNLVCVIQDGSTARSLPDGYPNIDGVPVDERESWFNALVDWWQRKKSRISNPIFFTHGSRIYGYGNDEIDQFQRAINMLRLKHQTSRSIMILINPETDNNVGDTKKFPSFSLVQIAIREGGTQSYELDCIGYFRKQEICYWWPINVGELARIQREAFIHLNNAIEGLTIGSITTIAARTHAGNTPPKVAIPALDRAYDDDPTEIWSMVYALFWREMPNRRRFYEDWRHRLRDLIPDEIPDPDGVPLSIDGLKALNDLVKRFSAHHATSPARGLIQFLDLLIDQNKEYARTVDPSIEVHRHWQETVSGLVEQMLRIVDEVFADV